MRVERDERGDYVLDPMALGQRFSISLDELRRRMRLGPRHEPCGGRRRRTRGIASIDGVVWRGGLASRHQCRWSDPHRGGGRRARIEPSRASGHTGRLRPPGAADEPLWALLQGSNIERLSSRASASDGAERPPRCRGSRKGGRYDHRANAPAVLSGSRGRLRSRPTPTDRVVLGHSWGLSYPD